MKKQDWLKTTIAAPDALNITRRGMIGLASWFVTYAVLGEANAALPAGKLGSKVWVARQQDMALALERGELTTRNWCLEAERLANDVDLMQLVAEVNAAELTVRNPSIPAFPKRKSIRFRDESGAPREVRYEAAYLDYGPASVIAPHGHRHMVAASVTLAGALRVRTYDRIGDVEGAMVIRPASDTVVAAGQTSTSCVERNNIHWFVPHGGSATALTIEVVKLDAGMPRVDIRQIDPLAGVARADGWIEAPLMTVEDSARKYTANI